MHFFRLFLPLLLLLAGLAPYGHAAEPGRSDVAVTYTVSSRVTADHSQITPGQRFKLAWQIKLEPEWHVYWKNPGDSGLAPEMILNNPAFTLEEFRWPVPKIIEIPPITNYGYDNEVILIADVTAPKMLPPGETRLPITLQYLYCKDVCLPGKVNLELPLMVGGTAIPHPAFEALQQQQAATLPLSLPETMDLSAHHAPGRTFLTLRSKGATEMPSHFMPATEGWMNDGAPQEIGQRNNVIQLTIPHDPHSSSLPPEKVEGLLVMENGTTYKLRLPVGDAPISTAGSNTLGTAIILAFIAGIILNLMPCVLPVIMLKVFALLQQTEATRLRHTLSYGGGVLLCLWVFAALVTILQATGQQVGWGFQMQSPLFVAGLCALMVILTLNFWDVFSAGHWLSRLSLRPTTGRETSADAFMTGLLAVVVATPCTVPFMGSAIAYAFAEGSLGTAFIIFTSLGLGMIAPLLLVALFPPLSALLPHPGNWMKTFKHILGWPMLATALWLAWVFARQTDIGNLILLLTLLLTLAFTLWIYGRHTRPWTLALAAFVALGGGYALHAFMQEPAVNPWQEWSPQAVQAARASGPVFVDFTADWCITCKVTEATVLNTEKVQTLFRTHNVSLFQADWTSQDERITEALASHGRRGVPLYLLYMPGLAEPQVLPQLPTYATIERALTEPTATP